LAKWLDAAAEAALVQGLRDRDPEAAASLVRLCLAELQGTARGWGLQDQDAYAVANETLARAVLAIGSFAPRPGATLRSWLFRILMNCIRTAARRENRLRAHEVNGIEFVEEDLDRDIDSIDVGVLDIRTPVPAPFAEEGRPLTSPVALVTSALLEHMSRREREVMIRTADGLSDQEIAADLGIKVGAVRAARLRARTRAADALQEIAPTLDETIHRRFRRLLS
jgi:RNA polymerase sigma factor (sigma-70 family)